MTFRVAGMLVLLCAGRASGVACPGSMSPMMAMVTDVAPGCFEACPQVCGDMEALISEYTTNLDRTAVEVKLRANKEPITCFFGKGAPAVVHAAGGRRQRDGRGVAGDEGPNGVALQGFGRRRQRWGQGRRCHGGHSLLRTPAGEQKYRVDDRGNHQCARRRD
mmetsp:Transcript_67666/g.195923  ORF Transcript_67666/g.195923 Transcript_67666/m.195923 type:complete len:163 (+) Transcript_67666:78-566(+)